MNKLAILSINVLFSVLISAIFFSIEKVSNEKFINNERLNLQNSYRKQFEQLAKSARNDLLQNNIHYARNSINKAMGPTSFIAYSIKLQDGSIVDESSNFRILENSDQSFRVSLPIYFTSDQELWGEINFLGSLTELADMSKKMQANLNERSFYFIIILFISLASLMGIFWISSVGLEQTITKILNDQLMVKSGMLTSIFWNPLIGNIKLNAKKFLNTKNELNEAQKSIELANLARQVAHDIRSPLSALKIVVAKDGLQSEESNKLIRMSLARMEKIADDLLKKYRFREGNALFAKESMYSICNEIVAEKRIIFGDTKIVISFEQNSNAFDKEAFCNVEPIKFKRVLSNLINNAVEANSYVGLVKIVLTIRADDCEILIADEGVGISKVTIKQAEKGVVDSSKINGNGLGLHDAITAIKSWGGIIEFNDRVPRGTGIVIRLIKNMSEIS